MKTLATIYHGQMHKVWKAYLDDDDVLSMLMNERGLIFFRTLDDEEVRVNLTKIDYIEYKKVEE